MGTPVEQVYNAFLSKVTADDWADEYEEVSGDLLPTAAAQADWLQILENALPYFKFPRVNISLTTDDDDNVCFVGDLGTQEIAIISEYMKIEWLDRTIHTWENVKVMYDERDWSPANLLKQFISLLETSRAKALALEKLYSRSIVEDDGMKRAFTFADLAGKE